MTATIGQHALGVQGAPFTHSVSYKATGATSLAGSGRRLCSSRADGHRSASYGSRWSSTVDRGEPDDARYERHYHRQLELRGCVMDEFVLTGTYEAA